MIYELATKEELQQVYNLVQNTIRNIYPKYYPIEVVNFFSEHHNEEAILRDIEKKCVTVLKENDIIIATGCYVDNHITRLYVRDEYLKKGCGSFIMKKFEEEISKVFDRVYLDASLPAVIFYEKLGFSTVKHDKYILENDVVLVYEMMEKYFE